MVRIGRIVGIHGLKGALRFRPDNPDSTTITEGSSIELETAGARRGYQVARIADGGRGVRRLELEGIGDANTAGELKGAIVSVAETDLPAPAPNEFYFSQVVGCEVALEDGSILGTIEEVFATGANDVWIVRGGGREVLVPVIADVVKAIDLVARRMTITAVPGLLD
jgi:16S rRNA processing protein RimM